MSFNQRRPGQVWARFCVFGGKAGVNRGERVET